MSLAKWVRAEFEIFKLFVKIILDEKVAQAKGNQFAQAVRYGGILTNKRKYQAFGIQFIDPKWRRNLVIAWALSAFPTDQMLLSLRSSVTRGFVILAIDLMALFP
jgi:hypothetical protein